MLNHKAPKDQAVPRNQNTQAPMDGDQDDTRANHTIPGDQIKAPDRRKATKQTESRIKTK